MHRGQAEKIGFDRQRVGVGHVGIGRIRHRRIKQRTVAADALVQGIEKLLVRVIADAGFLVGRDVGRIHRADQWQIEGEAARIGLNAWRGVTGDAIGGMGEIFTPLDQIGLRQFFGNACGVCACIVGQRNRRAIGERHRRGNQHKPGCKAERDDDDNRDRDTNGSHAYAMLLAEPDIGSRLDRFGGGVLDRLANADIGAAAADIARHRCVDIGIIRVRGTVEQRRRRHDLAGLAIAALRHCRCPSMLPESWRHLACCRSPRWW